MYVPRYRTGTSLCDSESPDLWMLFLSFGPQSVSIIEQSLAPSKSLEYNLWNFCPIHVSFSTCYNWPNISLRFLDDTLELRKISLLLLTQEKQSFWQFYKLFLRDQMRLAWRTMVQISHMRDVRRRSKVTKRQKERLTWDILPLCLVPAIRSSLRTMSGVLVMLCWVTELLWELMEPLNMASAAILICLSSSDILLISVTVTSICDVTKQCTSVRELRNMIFCLAVNLSLIYLSLLFLLLV